MGVYESSESSLKVHGFSWRNVYYNKFVDVERRGLVWIYKLDSVFDNIYFGLWTSIDAQNKINNILKQMFNCATFSVYN